MRYKLQIIQESKDGEPLKEIIQLTKETNGTDEKEALSQLLVCAQGYLGVIPVPYARRESPYKYPDDSPIKNGDVVLLDNGKQGFVFYDDTRQTWTVKTYDSKEKMTYVHTLEHASKHIVERLS